MPRPKRLNLVAVLPEGTYGSEKKAKKKVKKVAKKKKVVKAKKKS